MIPTAAKIRFVEALAAAGLPVVEVTSFVSPRAVPQLADADQVLGRLRRRPGVRYPVLVPNERGLDRALAAGATEIALFASATEAFAAANLQATIAEMFDRFNPVAARALAAGLDIRGYVSVAFGCPFQGEVSPTDTARIVDHLFALGCYEVSLADTIGRATPETVTQVIAAVTRSAPIERLALHLHDTGGRALANAAQGFALGIRTFDTAAGGLGGCPFAPGSPGNLATEAIITDFEGQGIKTGVDRDQVIAAVAALRADAAAGEAI